MKNILIIGANSELAQRTIEELKKTDVKIFATSRQIEPMDEKVQVFHLDVTKKEDFLLLKEKIKNIQFHAIINFAGIAVADAIEELDENEFKKQLEVNLFGLLRIIQNLAFTLEENGKLINISSMASYGIFPYISPYCISKASSDILLNLYSIEMASNKKIKTVSIRPGAVATKFWDSSIELNKKAFEKESYVKEKEFIKQNAKRNSLHAKNPIEVAKKIAKIILTKNPKSIYNIGFDAKIASSCRFLPQKILNKIILFTLKMRISKNK